MFKEIIELGFEKHWDYLTGLALTLGYIGFGFEKYSDYRTGLEVILYVGIGFLELPYGIWIDFICL